MLAKNLDSQIHELRELRRMADELATAIDTIQDAIKAEMTAAGQVKTSETPCAMSH